MKGIFLILFAGSLHTAVYAKVSKVRLGYSDSLTHVIEVFKAGKTPSVSLTNYSIPESMDEARLFFQLDYKKESIVEFRKFLQYIDALCIKGNESTIRKFIILSQFVDGYFAEDYFDSAKKICRSKRKIFCRVFDTVDIENKRRLIDDGISCHN